jgi:gluconolactonase
MPVVVATGLSVPEGPALLPDGRLLFTEQVAGRVSVLDGDRVEPVVHTGGSPNSVVVGSDDRMYICQNGGVVGAWRSADPRTPGVYSADFAGDVQPVAVTVDGQQLVAPNDLVFGADARLFFTDPGQPFDPANRLEAGRVCVIGPGRQADRVSASSGYCNGIALGADGSLVWVESYTRRVYTYEESQGVQTLCELPVGHVPDGLAVAEDGRLFIASCGSHGITVVGPDGALLDHLFLDDTAHPTNCCFDGSSLWVTDFAMDWASRERAGRLWRVDTDAIGAPVHRGRL